MGDIQAILELANAHRLEAAAFILYNVSVLYVLAAMVHHIHIYRVTTLVSIRKHILKHILILVIGTMGQIGIGLFSWSNNSFIGGLELHWIGEHYYIPFVALAMGNIWNSLHAVKELTREGDVRNRLLTLTRQHAALQKRYNQVSEKNFVASQQQPKPDTICDSVSGFLSGFTKK